MRVAGGVSSTLRREAAAFVQPGISTLEIDQYAGERISHYGGKSAFLGYRNYPCQICISVNEEVVHGLASGRCLRFGDIVSLDVGVRYDGYIGDNATTVAVGGCEAAGQLMMEVQKNPCTTGLAKRCQETRSWIFHGQSRAVWRSTDTASCENLKGTEWARKSTKILK